jgi:bromodomain-containing factor 1
LNHIKSKLGEGEYDEVNQINKDMKLMVDNAMKFNPPGHAVHTAAQQFQQIWEEKWRSLPAKEESRYSSEDPLGGDYLEDESDDDESE